MKKVKVKKEYDKDLLDKNVSKRDRRTEPGFTLMDKPPDWAIEKNLWGKERKYNRKIEGWEKLCVEAYFSGWIDFFDIIDQKGAIDHTIYFEWKDVKTGKEEEKYKEKKKDRVTLLKIYLKPEPGQALAPPAPVLVDRPPPPPMS